MKPIRASVEKQSGDDKTLRVEPIHFMGLGYLWYVRCCRCQWHVHVYTLLPSVNWTHNKLNYSGFPFLKNTIRRIGEGPHGRISACARRCKVSWGLKRLIGRSLNGPIFITELEHRTRDRFPIRLTAAVWNPPGGPLLMSGTDSKWSPSADPGLPERVNSVNGNACHRTAVIYRQLPEMVATGSGSVCAQLVEPVVKQSWRIQK